LLGFVQAPAEGILAAPEQIPLIVGVKCIHQGSQNKLDVARVDANGKVFQRYQAAPVVKELYVGYGLRDGAVDRSKPIILRVNQIYAVQQVRSRKGTWVTEATDSALRGRPHGSHEKLTDFLARWRSEFDRFCRNAGLVELHRITQGCVIEKTTGERFQLRNFDAGAPWMARGAFVDIRRVYRSPLAAIR
jgi:hypothetical protein